MSKQGDLSGLKYKILIALYLIIAAWFLYLHLFFNFDLDTTKYDLKIWASSYQIIALLGGILGIFVSRKWGGYKSIVGKAILFFSLGLLLQVFGQSFDSYLNVLKGVEIPYPALGDIGFFGSVVSYIIGAFYMLKSVGFKFSFKSVNGKLIAIVIPTILLISSYLFFLRGYEFDWSSPVRIFLDFGYPFGEAIYVSIAILAFLVSRNYLGGIMKKPIILLICALFFQYLCEFTFLYQANAGTWYAGGINDFMYFTSYFIMSFSLIKLGSAFYKIRNS
jgi:hypothetical protein